jgi:hypothetical protein
MQSMMVSVKTQHLILRIKQLIKTEGKTPWKIPSAGSDLRLIIKE